MKNFKRTDRLNHLFKEEISHLIQREVKDPRIGFVTIIRVKVSDDLSHAKVYVGVLEDGDKKDDSLIGLKKSAGFIRHRLGKNLRLRMIPELHFIHDENAEHAIYIGKLIDTIEYHSEPDEHPEDSL
ncbi:MAG: ribosome-binding factor A [Candidatus Cloacimonetes bacterium 4572_55]|nr:MAG: ribosome-binding factor A [Candidatus Cloacimonetes bacterium 4572_55]